MEVQTLPEVVSPATEVVEFGSFRSPETVLKEMEAVAKAFAVRAERLKLYKQIGTSKHLLIEGWQILGSMYRVTAGLFEDRYIELGDARGFEVTAQAIYVPTGKTISTAKAICLNDEENWGTRPKYEYVDNKKTKVGDVRVPLQQLLSMAQTRANSKVLSNLLKPIARMAGFAGTPAEEMTGHEPGEDPYQEPREKQKPQIETISEAQGKRLYAIAKQAGMDNAAYAALLGRWGYEKTGDVKRADYDKLVQEAQEIGEKQHGKTEE